MPVNSMKPVAVIAAPASASVESGSARGVRRRYARREPAKNAKRTNASTATPARLLPEDRQRRTAVEQKTSLPPFESR